MKRTVFIIMGLYVCFFMVPSPLFAAQQVAGYITQTKGTTTIIRNGAPLVVTVGAQIFTDDTLQTGPNGAMGVILSDETTLSLGNDSQLRIDQFVYQPQKKKYGFLAKVAKGVITYISGKIAKVSPDSVRLETPMATIGIRGTKLMIRVNES